MPDFSSPMTHAADFTDDDHRQMADSSPQSQRSDRSSHNGGAFSTTPKGKRSRSQLSVRGSVGKRSGTPAAEYLRWAAPESPYSPSRSFEQVGNNSQEDAELDFELHGESKSDEGYEGLENVRACCDGRHTVGHSGHHPSPPYACAQRRSPRRQFARKARLSRLVPPFAHRKHAVPRYGRFVLLGPRGGRQTPVWFEAICQDCGDQHHHRGSMTDLNSFSPRI